ncbi:MAG: hypothetical protein V9G12_10445 [Microthrixaceae bacterium]
MSQAAVPASPMVHASAAIPSPRAPAIRPRRRSEPTEPGEVADRAPSAGVGGAGGGVNGDRLGQQSGGAARSSGRPGAGPPDT